MDATIFLSLLFSFAAISSVITEAVKQFFKEKEGSSYNLIAIIIGLVVGICGTLLYSFLTEIPFTLHIIVYSILMGLAAALSSMVGYDKVKQLIEQLVIKK